MRDNEAHRLGQIMGFKGVSQDHLEVQSRIHSHRLGYILAGTIGPSPEELTKIAKSLAVDEVVIKNELAFRFWLFLEGKNNGKQFPSLWPALARQGGLRGPDNLQTERVESEHELFENLLSESGRVLEDNTRVPSRDSRNGSHEQMPLF